MKTKGLFAGGGGSCEEPVGPLTPQQDRHSLWLWLMGLNLETPRCSGALLQTCFDFSCSISSMVVFEGHRGDAPQSDGTNFSSLAPGFDRRQQLHEGQPGPATFIREERARMKSDWLVVCSSWRHL